MGLLFENMGLNFLETKDSKSIQAQLKKVLLSDLYEHTFPTTVYLDEEDQRPGSDTNTCPKSQLFPLQNPFPKDAESLVHISIHDHDKNILHNHILLPQSLMPVLDRFFISSRTWHLENVYSDSKTQSMSWVSIPLTFYHWCRTAEDFLTGVESALQVESSDPPRAVIVDNHKPGLISKHAFWIQVRGFFRGSDDVFGAARRQVCLLRWLVLGGYVVLGQEVLGADLGSGTMYVPSSEFVHSTFDLGSIRVCLGNRPLRQVKHG